MSLPSVLDARVQHSQLSLPGFASSLQHDYRFVEFVSKPKRSNARIASLLEIRGNLGIGDLNAGHISWRCFR